MSAIIIKILSAAMSVVVFLSGTFPVAFGGNKYINPYGEEVFIGDFYYFPEPEVISDRETFSELGYGGSIRYDSPKEYDFETSSVAAFSVEMSHSHFKIIIKSIYENGDTLFVDYIIVEPELHDMMYNRTVTGVVIETSKNIKNIELTSQKVSSLFYEYF